MTAAAVEWDLPVTGRARQFVVADAEPLCEPDEAETSVVVHDEHGHDDFELIEGVPTRLLALYAALAERHAVVREVDPGVFAATVAGFDGAWAEGSTADEAIERIPEAIAGWVLVKRRVGAQDIPIMEGIDFNPRQM